MSIFRKPGQPVAPQPLTREQMLAEIGEKASDHELTIIVKLLRNPTVKRVALNKAQEYL